MTAPPPPPGGLRPVPASVGFVTTPGMPAGSSADSFIPWRTRVCAWLLDYLPVSLLIGIGWGVLTATRETTCVADISEYDLGEFCRADASTVGRVSALAVFPVLALAYLIWNLGYRQGVTGCSIGKSIMGFQLIGEKDGRPIGFAMSLLREFGHLLLLAACGLLWFVAVLYPLWDAKRQTVADKIMSTVCVPLPTAH
ncbi:MULTISPECIES: RDD family protein [Mycobacteriaceae]|uniref:RDD family protein n=1 Tax=Mycolicibacterium parafortuitum TaxID=39692 RepID=A0ACC6MP68_MYCPF|nr:MULTISPECIES: RDD family protein [Mycobacteriaceae]MDZ5088662.1 RDD family protein [Mycolicibacterium parafortuitum]